MQIHPALPLLALLAFFSLAHAQVIDGQFPVPSNLKAGVAKIDITPTDTTAIKIVGHVRQVSSVRDPLRAGVLILDDGETKAAIVTMDSIEEVVSRPKSSKAADDSASVFKLFMRASRAAAQSPC